MNLKTENISVTIDGKKIIRDINIGAGNKEFIGIIGPNGSGKSTLLKTIYRYQKADTGYIYLDDQDIFNMSIKDSACKLGVVSQFNNLNFDFKVEDMVLIGRNPHKKLMEKNTDQDMRIMEESLRKVGMLDYRERNFLTLSGGEQQRVLLARALCQKVSLLILDEPTNHLDIKYQIQIMSLIKKLGITVVAALHDINLALAFCDKIYIMKEGKVFSGGDPREVISQESIREIFQVNSQIITEEKSGQIRVLYDTSNLI